MSAYLGTALRTLVALVALAGGVNFVVDPGEQLLRARVGPEWFERYAAALAEAPYGLPYVGSGRERELKWRLGARRGDCVVLGSSRASQLSSLRGGAVRVPCPELVNLWVPGGSLEDLTVLAARALDGGSPRLLLVVDPWMLAFDGTPGWRAWGPRYDEALARFGLPARARPRAPAADRWLATFSLPAFGASLALVARHRADLASLYRPAVPAALAPFDLHAGHPHDVTLPDGSRVYERHVLADARRGRMEALNRREVPRAVAFDPRAEAQLDAVLARLRAEGREVALVRVPYHPDVYRDAPERVAAYVAPAEAILERLAARHGLARHGSYDPRELGCRPGEFKDLRHPLVECLDRIDWKRPVRARSAAPGA